VSGCRALGRGLEARDRLCGERPTLDEGTTAVVRQKLDIWRG